MKTRRIAVSLCRSNPLFEGAWYRKTHIPFTHRFQAPQNRYGPRLQYSLEYLSPCSSSSAIGEPRPLTGRRNAAPVTDHRPLDFLVTLRFLHFNAHLTEFRNRRVAFFLRDFSQRTRPVNQVLVSKFLQTKGEVWNNVAHVFVWRFLRYSHTYLRHKRGFPLPICAANSTSLFLSRYIT